MKSRIELLPSNAEKLITHYFNLSVGTQKISTPYFINEGYDESYKKNNPVPDDVDRFYRKKQKQRVLIGKGKPEELEKVVREYAKKCRFDLDKATEEEIRNFMQKYGLGVDCSGFVFWVLDELTKQKFGKKVSDFITSPSKNPLKKILFKLRSVENTSVKVLINNSDPVETANIQVGDLLIAWNGQHVLLISKVEYNQQDEPTSFEYINSTWWYGKENGVRKGRVLINNSSAKLEDQQWDDFHDGEDWTFKGIKNKGEIRRLKF